MKQILLLIALLVYIPIHAQNSSSKGAITGAFYVNTSHPDYYFFYNGNLAYRILKPIDIGVNFGTHFIEDGSDFVLGIDTRFYILPYLYNRPVKTDLYIKATWQYEWVSVMQKFPEPKKYSAQRNFYGISLGFRYYPFKHIGFMIETGYSSYLKYNSSLGLSFKLKK